MVSFHSSNLNMCGKPHKGQGRNRVSSAVAEMTPNDRTQERRRPTTDVVAQ